MRRTIPTLVPRFAGSFWRQPMAPRVALAFACAGITLVCGCGNASSSSAPEKPHHKVAESPPAPALQEPVTSASLAEISGSAADDIWVVGELGTTLHYDGTTWSLVPSGVTTNLLGVWTGGASDAWAVGEGEIVLRWDGTSWSPALSPSAGVLIGVWGSSAEDVWAVGIDGGAAFVSRWNGNEWQYSGLDGEPSFWDVWGTGPNDVWAVGSAGPDSGHIFRYDGTGLNRI